MIFPPDEIKKRISADLNTDITIPSGHRGALVTFINNESAEIALATRIKDNWDVELLGKHDWTGDNQFGVISKLTW